VHEGRDLKTAHAGLGITQADWNNRVQHLVASPDKFKVAREEMDDLPAAASGLKKDIVEK
jgi:hemoglobin